MEIPHQGAFLSWELFPEVTSQFVSAIMGLCEQYEAVIETDRVEFDESTSSYAFSALRRRFISLIGRMGIPDILTLKHSDFPARLRGL